MQSARAVKSIKGSPKMSNSGSILKGASRMRRVILLIGALLLATALFTGTAEANGVASGTAIGNFATMTASNVPSSTQSNSVSTTVKAIFGVATAAEPADGSAAVGGVKDYVVRIKNPGNLSQFIGINVGAQSFGAGAGTTTQWSVAVDDADPFAVGLAWQTSGVATAAQAGDQATAAAALAPDAFSSYTLRVTTAGNAADGSTSAFTVKIVSTGTAYGPYSGYNATTYGGPKEILRSAGTGQGPSFITTTVQGPVLSITKSASSVTAPASYIANGGGGTDPVPGALVTYLLVFQNSGTSAATSVLIYDPLDINVTYYTNSIQSCFTGTGCALVADPDAAGGGDDCTFDNPSKRIICDMATMNIAGGGRASYQVTIN